MVALSFFGGIIAAQRFGGSAIGLGALGAAVVGLPLAALLGRARER